MSKDFHFAVCEELECQEIVVTPEQLEEVLGIDFIHTVGIEEAQGYSAAHVASELVAKYQKYVAYKSRSK
jgi:hypothetical protein